MRQEKMITLSDRGRDLVFKIKEMPATQSQRWLLRAGLLLASSGVLSDIEREQANEGNAIGAALGAVSRRGLAVLQDIRLDVDKVQPLLDDLLACCYRVDGSVTLQVTPDTVDGMIEDVRTLFALEMEAAKVNFGFFGIESPSATLEEPETTHDTSEQKISMRSRRS